MPPVDARARGGARRAGRLAARRGVPLLVQLVLASRSARRAPGAAGGRGRSARGVARAATGCARHRAATRGRGVAAGGRAHRRRGAVGRRLPPAARRGAACVQALVLELDPAERRELAGDGNEARSTRACSTAARRANGGSRRSRRGHGLEVFFRRRSTATATAERATPRSRSCSRSAASSGCASVAARCRGRSSSAPRAGWRTPRSTCGRWPPRATSRSSRLCARPGRRDPRRVGARRDRRRSRLARQYADLLAEVTVGTTPRLP